MNEVLMNALRLAALLAALAVVPAAHAQTSTVYGRPAGPTRTVDNKVPQPGQQDKIFPLGSVWTAVSLNGKPFTGDRPSFTLDDQLRARGFGGCNNYSATAYPLREQRLAVGPFALTKKSCDKATMAAEQAFLVALRTAAHWDIVGPILTIKTQSGELKFERAL
ncbi:META domain-containing protein [Microvirga thermotolerans]|uniref:META domain-containing protein n=1 Tax=Microvirga thermotolerans TaxID=2651334 RepID=A0A5P9JTH1_9HYPH|nr:META domain-containing protein [Microvirga thermotolerans]QFU15703.1 META domain-containing protein [Microvirga thermotolerans]